MGNLFRPRSMDELKQELLHRAKENRKPFLGTIYDDAAPVVATRVKQKLDCGHPPK